MSENGVTSQWECECSLKNSLRFKKCKSCGRDMPDFFKNKIFYEELKEQKAFVLIENIEKSKKRCLKIGSFLEKSKSAVAPIMVVLVIALNAGRIYLDSAHISSYVLEREEGRKERLWNEVDNAKETMTGLKSTPVIIETIFSDIVIGIEDVTKGLVDKLEAPEKHIYYEKIERAIIKIEGVIEYVTNRIE